MGSQLQIVFHPDAPQDKMIQANMASESAKVFRTIVATSVVSVLIVLAGFLWLPETIELALAMCLAIVATLVYSYAISIRRPRRALKELLEHQLALEVDKRHLELYCDLESQILDLDERHHAALYTLLFEQFKTLQPYEHQYGEMYGAGEWQGLVNLERAEEMVRILVQNAIELRKPKDES